MYFEEVLVDQVQFTCGVMDSSPKQGEAGVSVDLVGSGRLYVVLELEKSRDGVMVSTPEEEGKGTK
jgi:hypothetical protein